MELQFSDLGATRLVLRATSQALVEGDLPLPEGAAKRGGALARMAASRLRVLP